jgi:UDP-N-acetylmuramoyl-tripeptide--D-alanyl-D-alanine ligase
MTAEQIYPLLSESPGVATDSRRIEKDCLFFALKGETFNGNRFAAEALEKGAAYAIIDEKEYLLSEKTILVDHVLKTLQSLARLHRKKLGIPVLAITGSNGKTTTKELVAAVLSSAFKITCTQGNLNNHIGVPLTLLQMDKSTEIGIVEMGANHPGEIKELCSIADPDYGIITNIGRAHLEGFGSFDAIKKTKAELYNHLNHKNGTIFYNKDNPILSDLVKGFMNIISYGENSADITGHPVMSSPYIDALVNFPAETLRLKTKLTGHFNFENVLAAACIGNFFKVEPARIQTAVMNYTPLSNRSQLIEKNELKIIMDAYNANPTSMQASIDSFVSEFKMPRFLILGDMLELGIHSLEEHLFIIDQIKKHTFQRVFLVGAVFSNAAADSCFPSFPDSSALGKYLKQNPIKKGAVLVKGSRGIQLEKILEFL